MSNNMKPEDIIKKPWIVGFSDGSGHATVEHSAWEDGAWILVKDLGYKSIESTDWTVVVRGGNSERIKIGVEDEDVAQHIVRVHNLYISKKKGTLRMIAALEEALDFVTCAEVLYMRVRGTAKLVKQIKKALKEHSDAN